MQLAKILKLLGVPFLVFILSFLITVGAFLSLSWLDNSPPEVWLDLPSRSINPNQLNFSGSVKDLLSGVDLLRVEFRQGDVELLLLNLQLNRNRIHKFNVSIQKPDKMSITDGEAQLVISARDGSKRHNAVERIFSFIVDSLPPTVKFVSHPRVAERNKPFLCFFTIQEPDLKEVFLRDGYQKYGILRAFEYDQDLPEELYVATMTGAEYITAVDEAGNTSEATCPTELVESKTIQQSDSGNLAQGDALVLNEILKMVSTSQNRRLIDEVGLKFSPLSIEQAVRVKVGDFTGLAWSIRSDLHVKCPSSMRIEKIGQIEGQNFLVGDLGLGLRIILVGFSKTFLREGNLCSPDLILGQTSPSLRAYLVLRGRPVDIAGLLSGQAILDLFVRQSAQAKRAYGITNLSPLESASIRRAGS